MSINLWETLKLAKTIDPVFKQAMRDPEREFTILPGKGGKPLIYEVHQLTPDSANAINPVRAFTFEAAPGQTGIIYWDCVGESEITLPATSDSVKLQSVEGKRIKLKRNKSGEIVLPVGPRRVVTVDLPMEDACTWFNQAISTYKPI